MALRINHHERGGDPPAAFVAPARLCLDETRERIVPCDSVEARYLLAAEGTEVAAADVERYGLAPKPVPDPAPEPEPEPKTKAVKGPPEDKAMKGKAR